MSLYSSTGAFNVALNDTTGNGRYSASGALRINLVSGSSYVGLYAADGALNVVDVSGVSISTYGGLYHPSGALRGRTAPTTLSGLQAPDGSYYLVGLSSFTPADLFASGEQGAWYDPSDFSTMFQDSAGTTPVTAVEQPVGLILDKSKGLVIGSELVSNGGFDSATGWTLGSGWSISGGVATGGPATTSLYSTASIGATAGKTYQVTFTVTNYVSGTVRSNIGSNVNGIMRSANGTYTEFLTPTGGDGRIYLVVSSFNGSVDNISVRELPGNHASQSTSASRPVLSARYNLLTYTEQFNNAVWNKGRTVVSSNTAVAPDGTSSADTLETASGTSAGEQYIRVNVTTTSANTFSVYVKKSNWRYVGVRLFNYSIFDLDTETWTLTGAGEAVSALNVGNGWYRLSTTSSSTGAAVPSASLHESGTTVVWNTPINGTSVYIWGADLRVTNVGVGLPAYQRVAAATDYDTSGFPLYLKFDGVDDSLATGTIDPGASDKAQVFAGVRKLSDALRGCIVELGNLATPTNGSFFINAPLNGTAADYSFTSAGTSAVNATYTNAAVAAPITSVVTGLGDISGDSAVLRINGTQRGQSTADQGTGNFGSYPLYIGRRGGSTVPFNGQLYSMIVRFSAANLSDAQIASTENYVNNLTKAY